MNENQFSSHYNDSLLEYSELPSELIDTELQPLIPPISDSNLLFEYVLGSGTLSTPFVPTENSDSNINDEDSTFLLHCGESDIAHQSQTCTAPLVVQQQPCQASSACFVQETTAGGQFDASASNCPQHLCFAEPAHSRENTQAREHYAGSIDQCHNPVQSRSSNYSQLNCETNQTINYSLQPDPSTCDNSWNISSECLNSQQTFVTLEDDLVPAVEESPPFLTSSFEQPQSFYLNSHANDWFLTTSRNQTITVEVEPAMVEANCTLLGEHPTSQIDLNLPSCSSELSISHPPNIWDHPHASTTNRDSTTGAQRYHRHDSNSSQKMDSNRSEHQLKDNDSVELSSGMNNSARPPKKTKQKRNRLTKAQYAQLTSEQLEKRRKMLSSRSSNRYTINLEERKRNLSERVAHEARVNEQLQILHQQLLMKVNVCKLAMVGLRISSPSPSK